MGIGGIKLLLFVCVVGGILVLCEVLVSVMVGCAKSRKGAARNSW